MLDGNLNFPSNTSFAVAADSVVCRQSDVDISHHDCTLKFGAAARRACERPRRARTLRDADRERRALRRRRGLELRSRCPTSRARSDLAEVKQKGGGGATCAWAPGP